MLVSAPFIGTRLISLPFSDFAGPRLSGTGILKPLISSMDDLAKTLGVDYSEIRIKAHSRVAKELRLYHLFKVAASYSSFAVDLRGGATSVRRGLSESTSRGIKKAQQSGVDTVEATDDELLASYYQLHLRTSREHGVPPHSRRFFEHLFKHVQPSGQMSMYLSRHQGRIVSGIVIFSSGKTAHYWQGVLPAEFRRLNPFHLLLWSAVEEAAERGCAFFDLGRTRRGTGTYQFKRGWGGEEYEIQHLCHYYTRTRSLPDPEQPAFRAARKAWQLVPTRVAERLGPLLTRGIGL